MTDTHTFVRTIIEHHYRYINIGLYMVLVVQPYTYAGYDNGSTYHHYNAHFMRGGIREGVAFNVVVRKNKSNTAQFMHRCEPICMYVSGERIDLIDMDYKNPTQVDKFTLEMMGVQGL